MKIDISNLRVRWINVDADTEKASRMVDLLNENEFKNHQRFSAVTGIEPHEGVREGEEHYRNCAESHFKVLEETILKDGEPVLILEDDVEATKALDNFTDTEFDFPDDAHAVYMGTSHGDGQYEAMKHDQHWLKIKRVFATHAILYFSKEYANQTIEIGKRWIYDRNMPFDVGLAYELQPNRNVYAPIVPTFYQADSKNTKNKWEEITKTPLRITEGFKLGTMK